MMKDSEGNEIILVRNNRLGYRKVCKLCGHRFDTRRENKLFCKEGCRMEWYRLARKFPTTEGK